MAVGFASYEIARSGLTFNERGLDVTGHNIANVNTKGYTRQQAIAQASFYIKNNAKYGYGQVGTGVDVQQTRQIRMKFLDDIYRCESAKSDYWGVRLDAFSEIEGILGEPIDAGLQTLLNSYWNAWQELSKDPTSLTARSLVRQVGEALAYHMNKLGSQFDQLQLELDAQFASEILKLDSLCARVAELNGTIRSIQLTGEAPNDLMDERNLLLDQIASMIDCEIYERDDGMRDVIQGGAYLVFRDTSKRVVAQQTPETGLFHKAFVVMREGEPPLLEELRFGQCMLKGILESRGDYVQTLDVGASRQPLSLTDPLASTVTSDVLFSRGSLTNGSPNTKADIVVMVDVSDTSAEYLESLKMNIDSMVDGLLKKGLDFNLKLVAFGSSATAPASYSKDEVDAFIAGVLSLSTDAGDTSNNFGGTGGALEALEAIAAGAAGGFREDANRYAVLITGEPIDGGGLTAADALSTAQGYADRLAGIGVSLSVVTDSAAIYDGAGPGDAPFGWSYITGATAGAAVAFDETVGGERALRGFAAVLKDASDHVERDVNDRMSVVAASLQIAPDVRKRLNALINIVCRAVNELHRSGMTLESPPLDGEDFFVPINAKYPLEMGNIQINPKILAADGLNYIVASASGAPEDNNVALAIANLRNLPGALSNAEGRVTIDDYYRDAIFSISNSAAESQRYLSNQVAAAGAIDQLRHSIADVSMDEELAAMMKFRFGYESASRVLSVIDSMIETVVTRLGLVGR